MESSSFSSLSSLSSRRRRTYKRRPSALAKSRPRSAWHDYMAEHFAKTYKDFRSKHPGNHREAFSRTMKELAANFPHRKPARVKGEGGSRKSYKKRQPYGSRGKYIMKNVSRKQRPCKHGRNETTGKCRRKGADGSRKQRPCKHGRDETTGKCRRKGADGSRKQRPCKHGRDETTGKCRRGSSRRRNSLGSLREVRAEVDVAGVDVMSALKVNSGSRRSARRSASSRASSRASAAAAGPSFLRGVASVLTAPIRALASVVAPPPAPVKKMTKTEKASLRAEKARERGAQLAAQRKAAGKGKGKGKMSLEDKIKAAEKKVRETRAEYDRVKRDKTSYEDPWDVSMAWHKAKTELERLTGTGPVPPRPATRGTPKVTPANRTTRHTPRR